MKLSAGVFWEVVAKWLQGDAVWIKILLHSHNVIDMSPNPNDTKYRSTQWVRGIAANDIDYHFTSFETRKEKKSLSSSWEREVLAAPGLAGGAWKCLPVWDSTYTQCSVKSFGQWTLQVHTILMSPLPFIPLPNRTVPQPPLAVLQLYLSTWHSHNTSLKLSITVFKIKKM